MQCLANKQHFLQNIASNLPNLLITVTYKLNLLGYTAPDSYEASLIRAVAEESAGG
jgi:hypothetical protein